MSFPLQQEPSTPSSPSSTRNCPQLVVSALSFFLLLAALVLGIVGMLSPSWQVVDIREFQAEHHHGLWLDCTRAERSYSRNDFRLAADNDKSPLHCTYKFDSKAAMVLNENVNDLETNSAAVESQHHQFYGWHKACLIFMVVSMGCGFGALFVGLCSPCSTSCSMVHSVLIFLAFMSSIIASAVFFFAAHRVDARFVQGLVGTYEQGIGEAFFFYLAGCVLLMLVFILSVITTYTSLRASQHHQGEQLVPLYPPPHHNNNNNEMRYFYGKTTV